MRYRVKKEDMFRFASSGGFDRSAARHAWSWVGVDDTWADCTAHVFPERMSEWLLIATPQ